MKPGGSIPSSFQASFFMSSVIPSFLSSKRKYHCVSRKFTRITHTDERVRDHWKYFFSYTLRKRNHFVSDQTVYFELVIIVERN